MRQVFFFHIILNNKQIKEEEMIYTAVQTPVIQFCRKYYDVFNCVTELEVFPSFPAHV